MIRSRDLFLFVLVVLFLGIAISATVWFDTRGRSVESVPLSFVDDTATSTAAAPAVALLDRTERIADLRAKIAADTSTITPAPSVEGSAGDGSTDDSGVSSTGSTGVQRCLYPDDMLARVPQWPLSGVQLRVIEGARVVMHTENVVSDVVGTSTVAAPEQVTKTLLTMPLAIQPLATPHCLPSEIIGVSISGYLMFNSDVRAFRGLTADMLIGYARDGYPIYGPYSGELDQCGGYQSPTGYRYSLAPDRDYVLGCFTGTPAAFTL